VGGTPNKEGEGQTVNEVLDSWYAQGRVDICAYLHSHKRSAFCEEMSVNLCMHIL
jgi:hypothetical protein